MEALVERDQAGTRFSFVLIAVFAAIAVMLAGVGLYGVLSTVVRPRTAEIGLRMALGRRLKYSRWFLDTDCFSARWASRPAWSWHGESRAS
jgi:predicted small integral membrane protein